MTADTVIHIRADNGVPFIVRLVRKGERYGLERCLTHPHRTAPDPAPMVEFYDARYPMHGDAGQFVSRYYVSTLEGCTGGLDLYSGVAEWSVDSDSMDLVRAWLRHITAVPGQE